MKCFSTKTFSVYFFILSNFFVFAQTNLYTHADSLRGSITDARKWWDLTHYDLHPGNLLIYEPEPDKYIDYK